MALDLISTLFGGADYERTYDVADLGSGTWAVLSYEANDAPVGWRASVSEPGTSRSALKVAPVPASSGVSADGGYLVQGDTVWPASSFPGALSSQELSSSSDVQSLFFDPPTRSMRMYDSTFAGEAPRVMDPRGGRVSLRPGARMAIIGGAYRPIKGAVAFGAKVVELDVVKTFSAFQVSSTHMHFGWLGGSGDITSFDYVPAGDTHYGAALLPFLTATPTHLIFAGDDSAGAPVLEWVARDTAEHGSVVLPGQDVVSTVHVVGTLATVRVVDGAGEISDVTVNLATSRVTSAPSGLTGPWLAPFRVGDYRLPGQLSFRFGATETEGYVEVALGAERLTVPLPATNGYSILDHLDCLIVSDGVLALGVSARPSAGREYAGGVVPTWGPGLFWAFIRYGQPGNLTAKPSRAAGYFS